MTPYTTGQPYTRGQRWRIVVFGAVLPILVVVVGIALVASWAGELPDPVAIHWSGSGAPDGFGSVVGLVLPLALFIVVFSLAITLGTLFGRGGPFTRFLVGTGVWLSVLLTVTIVGSLAMQRGLADAADAGSVLPFLLVGAVAGLVLAIPSGLLTPRAVIPVAGEVPAPPRLGLNQDERVLWSRRVALKPWISAALFGGVIVLFAVAVVSLIASERPYWTILLLGCAVLLLALASSYWRVRVTAAGFTVRSLLGFPRFSIPLEQIESARVTEVSAMGDFGGWGLRWGTNRRIGIVVRSGEALEVTPVRGRSVVVTVSDAASAVALIAALRERNLETR